MWEREKERRKRVRENGKKRKIEKKNNLISKENRKKETAKIKMGGCARV
jgi:hypothetical protein